TVMVILLVHIHVKPDRIDAFKMATLDNARHSVEEHGCARFDLIPQPDDPTRPVPYEAYQTTAAAGRLARAAGGGRHTAPWRPGQGRCSALGIDRPRGRQAGGVGDPGPF